MTDPNMGNPGQDPKAMKIQFAANAEKRKVDQAGLYNAIENFAPNKVVNSFRVIRRDDDVRNKNRNQLGTARFDASGPFSVDGDGNMQALTRWLSGHPEPDSGYGSDYPADKRAEIEIKVVDLVDGKQTEVWKNCATGEINKESYFLVDGRETGNE